MVAFGFWVANGSHVKFQPCLDLVNVKSNEGLYKLVTISGPQTPAKGVPRKNWNNRWNSAIEIEDL